MNDKIEEPRPRLTAERLEFLEKFMNSTGQSACALGDCLREIRMLQEEKRQLEHWLYRWRIGEPHPEKSFRYGAILLQYPQMQSLENSIHSGVTERELIDGGLHLFFRGSDEEERQKFYKAVFAEVRRRLAISSWP
jgi:hypothetical protein